MTPACIVPLFLSLAAHAPAQTPQPWVEGRVATVPDGLVVQHLMTPVSNRFVNARRSRARWSSDGRVVAYAAQKGERYVPVVGNVVGEPFGYVWPPVVAGGRAFFHVANTTQPGREAHCLWVDGKSLPIEDILIDFGVSPDGKSAAYWTLPGGRVGNFEPAIATDHFLVIAKRAANGGWTVRRGEERSEPHSAVPPRFSADGQRVLTVARGPAGDFMLESAGGRETAVSDSVPSIDAFSMSANGSAVAFVRTDPMTPGGNAVPGARDGAELYFKKKRVGKKHAGITLPTVDARGDHVAYSVLIGSQRAVVIDDERPRAERYDHVFEMSFDPTGARLAFVANVGGVATDVAGVVEGGTTFVVVRPLGKGDVEQLPGHTAVREIVWDAKGERLAYVAFDRGGWRVVCGNERSEPHEDAGTPHFSADGRTIGFGTVDGRELWWRVLPLD